MKPTSPRALADSILQNVSLLCPFDQGQAYFFDANGKICGQQLWNIDEKWSFLYLNYYASRDQHYSCYKNVREDVNYRAKYLVLQLADRNPHFTRGFFTI